MILDDARYELKAGESLEIPVGAVHCAGNMSLADCLMEERQEGICFEDDITRYMDAYGRDIENNPRYNALESIALYNKVLTQIRRRS